MEVQSVYIHAGVHKTGSTYVQSCLGKKIESLNQLGYSVLLHSKELHIDFFKSFIYQGRVEEAKQWLQTRLIGYSDKLIISEEEVFGSYIDLRNGELYPYAKTYLSDLLEALPLSKSSDVNIIISVRHFMKWLESSYLQFLKKKASKYESFSEFSAGLDFSCLSWSNLIFGLLSVDQRINIYIHEYKGTEPRNSILKFLEEATKVPFPEMKCSASNPSLSETALDILALSKGVSGDQFRRLRKYVLENFGIRNGCDRAKLLEIREGLALDSLYSKDILRLKEAALNDRRLNFI